MKLEDRVIPKIPPEEKAYLDKINKESPKSGQWRDIVYAVMSKTLRGAKLDQKDGVALKALSSKKDDTQIGPMTIYSNRLDQGNIIELAIEPEKLADTLTMNAADTHAWLKHLQDQVAHWAEPKTSQRYPRVGIRSESELEAVLDAWDVLVERRWPSDVSAANKANEYGTNSSALAGQGARQDEQWPGRAGLEQAAQEAGFDLAVATDGRWLLFRSSAFPLMLGVSAPQPEAYVMALTDAVIGRRMADEFHLDAVDAQDPWVIQLEGLAGLAAVHRLLLRIAAMARLVSGAGLREFEARTQTALDATELVRLVRQRVGQDIFRESLLAYWGARCAVSGLDVPELLRASHIKPWSDCETDAERLDVFNGLLLAPNLDALFDGGWVTFSEEGALVTSPLLSAVATEKLGVLLNWRLASIAQGHRHYLTYHRQHVFQSGNVSQVT